MSTQVTTDIICVNEVAVDLESLFAKAHQVLVLDESILHVKDKTTA